MHLGRAYGAKSTNIDTSVLLWENAGGQQSLKAQAWVDVGNAESASAGIKCTLCIEGILDLEKHTSVER